MDSWVHSDSLGVKAMSISNGFYEKDMHIFLKSEYGAKSYYRNCPNYPHLFRSTQSVLVPYYHIELMS